MWGTWLFAGPVPNFWNLRPRYWVPSRSSFIGPDSLNHGPSAGGCEHEVKQQLGDHKEPLRTQECSSKCYRETSTGQGSPIWPVIPDWAKHSGTTKSKQNKNPSALWLFMLPGGLCIHPRKGKNNRFISGTFIQTAYSCGAYGHEIRVWTFPLEAISKGLWSLQHKRCCMLHSVHLVLSGSLDTPLQVHLTWNCRHAYSR